MCAAYQLAVRLSISQRGFTVHGIAVNVLNKFATRTLKL
jgi:hypothetical protein